MALQRATRHRLFTGFNSIGLINPRTEVYDIELVKRDLLNPCRKEFK